MPDHQPVPSVGDASTVTSAQASVGDAATATGVGTPATPPTVDPHVYLSAGETKNGRAVEQPLPADLAADLRAYLSGRPEREPVWPGTWWTRAADMYRGMYRDMDRRAIAGEEG